ncbi:YybH family protein [Roseimaritima ulvae]|uniref:DUF4440 domain-containing protein n=1 Tax=Roseimaritima ulvae TaxID=980254 RepID=A0A5B9QL20_9BACT|nr:nuclear transport factor 2 family protein [Roseimaritima ulvae]QEG38250.1 hypothetical protein UC8_02050 [Roseimaritima ulvae]
MKFYPTVLMFLSMTVAITTLAWSQDTPPDAPAATQPDTAEAATDDASADHEQLRELREILTEAVLKNDVETQLQHVDDQIVTTWQNNQVARGREGLEAFMAEMSSGDSKVFQGYTVRPAADDISVLHGGHTAIAVGKSVPHYKIMGMEFDLENRWTATLVKKDGQWKLAAYHVSGNILDNPVLDAAKGSLVWVGGIAAVVGLLAGMLLMKIMNKSKSNPA